MAHSLMKLLTLAAAGALCTLRLGAASPGFAVIVHRSNPTTNLSVSDVRSLFDGTTPHWPDHSKVVLAERDGTGAATVFLTQRLLKLSLVDYKRNLANLEFQGAEPVIVRVLNSDQIACKFVFNVPAAVGLIDAASLAYPECAHVRVVKVEGRLPGQEGYRLK